MDRRAFLAATAAAATPTTTTATSVGIAKSWMYGSYAHGFCFSRTNFTQGPFTWKAEAEASRNVTIIYKTRVGVPRLGARGVLYKNEGYVTQLPQLKEKAQEHVAEMKVGRERTEETFILCGVCCALCAVLCVCRVLSLTQISLSCSLPLSI